MVTQPHKRHMRASLEIDFNGAHRTFPSEPCSLSTSGSSSEDDNSSCPASQIDVASTLQAAAEAADAAAAPPHKQQQQQQQQQHHHHHHHKHGSGEQQHITPHEWANMALLVVLYAMQGIPLGLTMGAMPFLLQAKLSMTQMGIFSMAGYPYSFKLLWSPIVDSVYSAAFGRRKSWIVPVQLASAALLICGAGWIQEQYEAGGVVPLTVLFFFFVLLAATQDIAVDGWALTLLPPHHIEYASTCQTLGMNTGYFTSFTIFLALSNAEFCNKYIRANSMLAGLLHLQPSHPEGLVSLKGYIGFWGWAFTALTLAITLFKQEEDHLADSAAAAADSAAAAAAVDKEEKPRMKKRSAAATGTGPVKSKGSSGSATDGADEQCLVANGSAAAVAEAGGGDDWSSRWREIRAAYVQLWEVVQLPAIWGLSALLLSYRLGVLPAESAASLKLLDKGVAKEALAALVLVQFPVELVSAVVAGRWASSHSPYQPFMAGYFVRLLMAVLLTALARAFPPGASSFMEHSSWFGALSAVGLVTSFSSTLMFTALGSFFNRISDPVMGGAYLTLLNTIANMGIILPKIGLYAAMDWLTVSSCRAGGVGGVVVPGLTCPKKIRELAGSNACTNAGHTCQLDMDGFYSVSFAMTFLGLLLGLAFARLFPRLTRLPLERWRAKHGSLKAA